MEQGSYEQDRQLVITKVTLSFGEACGEVLVQIEFGLGLRDE